MATVLKLGPTDHGRPLTWEEYRTARYTGGYQYELIDGKLYVTVWPEPGINWLEGWVFRKLQEYADDHPDIINYVTTKSAVFVPSRSAVTCPQPDLAAYRGFPDFPACMRLNWEDISPVLVGEVLCAENPDKDLVRNVELYLEVPSIREYWIVDHRRDMDHPQLLVYRRRGARWQRVITVNPGATYSTRLLPGFALLNDPHSYFERFRVRSSTK